MITRRNPCLAFLPLPVTQLPSTRNTWMPAPYPGPPASRTLKHGLVLVEESLKRIVLPLLFCPRARPSTQRFRYPHVSLPIQNQPQNEISESSLRKTATCYGDVSSFSFFSIFVLFSCFVLIVTLRVSSSCRNKSKME